MTSPQSPIGLVGVGLLGSAIADRLAAAGFDVLGYDVDHARVEAAVGDRVLAADSCAHIARQCRRIVLSLPDSDVVGEVMEGQSGLASAAKAGTIIVDTTTGRPAAAAELADRLAAASITYLDATVAGSSEQLRRRDVTLMVGGDEAAFDACGDLFAAWSDRVFHTGPAGSGARTKLLVNQVIGLHRLVLAEALALAGKLDVDQRRLVEILKATPAYSRAMDTKASKMIAGDFTPQARLQQHRKDVGLILELAQQAKMPLPVSQLHADLLDAAIEAGLGELDNSAIIRVLTGESAKT